MKQRPYRNQQSWKSTRNTQHIQIWSKGITQVFAKSLEPMGPAQKRAILQFHMSNRLWRAKELLHLSCLGGLLFPSTLGLVFRCLCLTNITSTT